MSHFDRNISNYVVISQNIEVYLITRNHYKISRSNLCKLREITPLFREIEVSPIACNPVKLHEMIIISRNCT